MDRVRRLYALERSSECLHYDTHAVEGKQQGELSEQPGGGLVEEACLPVATGESLKKRGTEWAVDFVHPLLTAS